MKNKYLLKIMHYFIFIIAVMFVLLHTTGCLTTTRRSLGLEPQAYHFNEMEYEILGSAEGQSSSFNLFWLFPVTPRIDYKRAVDEAISNKGGNNLIEVNYWIEQQYWIVGTVDILYVKGKVIRYGK